ncbi:MAG: DUF2750 domain-containing protein [Alphaproteobacteria bacterium]|nr:DUF2750 domain-containing protein [Alphaproteobacteria bacterium]
MLIQAKTPQEQTHRDRFFRRIATQRHVYAVSGEDGLARVPSRTQRGRDVTLFWSLPEEAERWAKVVAENPRVKDLTLSDFLGEILPALAELKRLAGLDWTAEPMEIEADPTALAERIRLETLDAFVIKVVSEGRLFTLEDSGGPALMVSGTGEGQQFLPCWSERALAEARIAGLWRDMLASEIPLQSFIDRTLLWLEDRGALVAPEHVAGALSLELAPADLRSRLIAAQSN